MGYRYWKTKEYSCEKKFQDAGFPKTERLALSRNVMENTNEDVIVPELGLLVDVKSTVGKESIRIKKEDLDKIQSDAKKNEKIGIVVFSFKQDKNTYVILNLEDFFKFVKH
jgi:hypothetical protein